MKANMTTKAANRVVSLVLASAALLLHAVGATAAPKAGLPVLENRGAASTADLPAAAKAQSGISGTLNPGALSAPVLELTLADGTTIQARLQRVAQDGNKGTQSWVGTFDDAPGSVLVLSKAKGVITGFANYKDQLVEILPATGGRHVQFAVDGKRVALGDGVVRKATGSGDTLTATTTDYGTGGATISSTTNVVQDLLVLYTSASAAKWGQATLESKIQSAVQAANQAYLNSNVPVTLNIVGMQQSSITESSSGMQATLSALLQNSTVRSLRDSLAADMVVLVDENTDWCGYANLWVTNTATGTNVDAYAVVQSACLVSQSLAHEVGHLQGLDHNRENAGSGGTYPYSYGYRVCAADGFRDVMSYDCATSVPRILQLSNPSIYYSAYATGISYEADPSHSAEAARSLINNAVNVANYRVAGSTSSSMPPAAPSGLVIQSAAYNKVVTGWTDNASNETGFKVERSADGVTYVEIATLGSGAQSFADTTVAASQNYYYRVRAYNSVGASGYSNTVRVATPSVPPPPPAAPTAVAAANDADGTAAVSWTPASTAASSYEVRREKWDSRKSAWTGATTVATVPSSVLSLIDASGTGTYRYSVRAVNSGGASGYAGPASVTVTNVTKVTGKAPRK